MSSGRVHKDGLIEMSLTTTINHKVDYYSNGYRDGHLDRYMGLEPLMVALTYPEYNASGYATGYHDGYYFFRERRDSELLLD